MAKSFNTFNKFLFGFFALFFIASYLYVVVTNNKTQKQLQHFATEVLGTRVYFDNFDMSHISQTMKIKGVHIRNLKGFPNHDLITIDDIRVTSDDFSAKPLVINSIFINGMKMYQTDEEEMSNNFSFFNDYQTARRKNGFALEHDRKIIIKALITGNATLEPTQSTASSLPEAYPIEQILLKDIGAGEALTASHSLSQTVSYFSRVAQRHYLKARIAFSTKNLSNMAQDLGSDLGAISDDIANDVLDIGTDLDEGLRSFGKSLGDSFNQMRNERTEELQKSREERERAQESAP